MAEIKLYKNGKVKSMWGERGASLLESQGWSKKAPPGAPSYTPRLTPAEQTAQKYQNVTQQTVYKNGKSTVIHSNELQDYLNAGYSQSQEVPKTPEIETPIVPEAITPEQLTPVELPEVGEPYQPIQDIFGAEWKPAPIFEQLGLTEQGIFGAVRVKGMDDVYTIGEGGRKETAESYLERFGTAEQQGIVGEISMEEAKALGITVGADSIVEPLDTTDPYEKWAEFRDEEKAEIDALREKVKKVTQTLIDTLMGFGETKAEAKEEEKEKLGLDEKDKAIADAQKIRNDLYNVYEKSINELTYTGGLTYSQIGGRRARMRAQRAIELAPLDSNLMIAQDSYDRAKDLLDEWSSDYNESMQFQMQATQMNIDMLTGELDREQAENLQEAQIKFDMWQADYNANLQTQEEVKKLMLMYPEAGVSIADSWEDAYKKISPFIQDEADFEKKMRDLDLKIKEKALEPTPKVYAPSAAKKLYNELGGQEGTGMTFNEWYKEQSGDEDVVGDIPQWQYELGVRPGMTTEEANKILRESPGDNFYQSLVDYFTEDKDLGLSRKDIEKREKGNLTAEHIKALDQVYGQDKESRSFWKDLGTVIDWTKTLR